MPIPIVEKISGGYQASTPVSSYYGYNKTLICCDPNKPYISEKEYAAAQCCSDINAIIADGSDQAKVLQAERALCIKNNAHDACVERKNSVLDPYYYY
jgi:hypothetical protein